MNNLYNLILNESINIINTLKGVQQDTSHHQEGDAYEHTLLVMQEAAKLLETTKVSNSYLFMKAAAFHDLGKATTTKVIVKNNAEKIVSYGHDKASSDIIKLLDIPETEKEYLSDMAAYHMLPLTIINDTNVGIVNVTKWLQKFKSKEARKEVILLSICDCRGKIPAVAETDIARTVELWNAALDTLNNSVD